MHTKDHAHRDLADGSTCGLWAHLLSTSIVKSSRTLTAIWIVRNRRRARCSTQILPTCHEDLRRWEHGGSEFTHDSLARQEGLLFERRGDGISSCWVLAWGSSNP
eukprot:5685720-Prymnesium_polylepis.1